MSESCHQWLMYIDLSSIVIETCSINSISVHYGSLISPFTIKDTTPQSPVICHQGSPVVPLVNFIMIFYKIMHKCINFLSQTY